jgi:predicted dehydrogenase
MEKIRMGVAGIGGMGSNHAQTIAGLENCQLEAVCDSSPKTLDKFSAPGADKVSKFTDYKKFLKEAKIDAVLIATPHYYHPDMAAEAMRAGKHVLVEKPVAVHKKAAEELLAVAAQFPKLVKCAMFNQRAIPAHKKIKSLINSGELGDIYRISWIVTDWFRTQAYYNSGSWRATWAGEGGGVLLNQCPHQLDLMQWFFGMPEKVSAVVRLGRYHDIEVEDDVNATLEYPGGAVGNFISSTGEAPGTNRLEISADRGRLVFERGKLEFIRTETSVAEFRRHAKTAFGLPELWNADIPAATSNPSQHRDIIKNFADAILSGEKLIAPLEDGIRGLELGNAMLLSGLRGKTVSLPMDSNEYAALLAELTANSKHAKK